MPLLRNKFQPYFPDPDSPNRYQCGPEKYCWPVQIGDKIKTQFYQTPCENNLVCDPTFEDVTLGADIIVNGSFIGSAAGWTLGTNWAWIPNEIEYSPFPPNLNPPSTYYASQTGSGFVACQAYRITIDIAISAGYLVVNLGINNPTYTNPFTETGTYVVEMNYGDNINDVINLIPSEDFGGRVYSIKAEPIDYNCWDWNCSWLLDTNRANQWFSGTGDLVNTTTNYIIAGKTYLVKYELLFYVSGSTNANLSTTVLPSVSANGYYEFYATATVNGTLSFSRTSDFIGTISNIEVYEMKNDYVLELIDSNGNAIDISDTITYYNQYVTIDVDLSNYEIADGCYYLQIYDECVVTSNNLVFDPLFANGYTYWIRNNGVAQYDDTGDQMKFIFDPFGQGFTDYVTNGDFSGGATGWTLGANWSIVGGKAVHTPGSTAALYQTMTLPIPAIGTNYSYYVGFTISNWTVGSVTVKLGNAVNGTSYTWKGNDTMIQIYIPRQSGSVDITFTPTSTFDGEIDDIAVVLTSGHSAFPILTNVAQPLFTPGTYQTEWEIISSSDPNISVRTNIIGAIPATTYESTVGVQSFTQSYGLSGGNVFIVANFSKTDPNYIQVNYVAGDITVDNINVQKIEPFEATYVSECLNYSSNSIPRTKMIIGYCDQNALGFDFENTGFKLMHRAEIRSLNPNYPSTTEIMKSGRGNDRTVYGELEKYWQVTTDFASETFHDTMAAILICDHLQMGDTEGTVTEYSPLPEEYSPNWNGEGAYSLATATFQVRVKENGQKFNRHT